MAKFTVINMADLSNPSAKLSLTDVTRISDGDKQKILRPAAEVLAKDMQEYLLAHHNRTGKLADSISISGEEGGKLKVAPASMRKKIGGGVSPRFHGKSGYAKNTKHHGTKGGSTYEEVAWYLEYGTKRMHATKWFTNAMNEAEADVDKALQEAFDNLIGGK